MDIVVLAGGLSPERDVSLVTGNMVCKSLRKKGHSVLLLDVFLGCDNREANAHKIFEKAEDYSLQVTGIEAKVPDIKKIKAMRPDSKSFFGPNVIEICQAAELVFIALHGEDGENGRIQAAFDLFGINYTGSGYLASALAMDKSLAKYLFCINNIPVPEGTMLKKNEFFGELSGNIRIPCVVKPCCGGSSIGVSIVKEKEVLLDAVKEAFLYESQIIVEDYIEGREFSVGVLDGQALPVIEIEPVNGFYNYENKYKAGNAVETCPADLPEKIAAKMQQYAKEAVKVLGLGTYSRMDFLLDSDHNIYCLEANTLPGMTATSLIPQEALADGMDFDELCEKIVMLSYDKRY